MKCQAKDCQHDAAGAIAINVPALGCPIEEHTPLRMVLGLQLCADHIESEKGRVQEWFAADPRYQSIFRVQARGMAPPDFNRAFITPVSFDSDEWKILSRGRA